VCISGNGFTPGGDVTIQYSDVPQMPTDNETVPWTPQATFSGGLQFVDTLDPGFIAESIASGATPCSAGEIANGKVTISAIDEATGVLARTQVPASYWCQSGLGPYLQGCPLALTAIDAGTQHACAVLSGALECWGDNSHGQLGLPPSSPRLNVLNRLQPITSVGTGATHTCATFESGSVACWGHDEVGELGNGVSAPEDTPSPVGVVGIANASAVVAGSGYSCALLATGSVECWGDNRQGQLGVTSSFPINPATSSVPLQVVGITNAIALSAGEGDTCALLGDGTVDCWGASYVGVPQPIPGLAGAVALSAPCAILANGNVACWTSAAGSVHTMLGLLGTPIAISTNRGLSAPGSGDPFEVCVVLADGSVQCAGQNQSGQLGNGTTADSDGFVAVTGLPARATSIAVGLHFACATLSNQQVWCWGDNGTAQLGSPPPPDQSSTPVMAGLIPL
jgi:alpha-tubulin suppressor-like RCC1 family protein